MPSNTIVMPIDIKQNRNALSKVYGHYFPEVHCRQTLSTYGLAKHMADHGSLVSEEILRLVLGQLVKCLPELLAQGIPVKLDGLGIFRPYAKSVPGGAASVEEASQMGANNLVDGIRIRFIPESEDLRDLTEVRPAPRQRHRAHQRGGHRPRERQHRSQAPPAQLHPPRRLRSG